MPTPDRPTGLTSRWLLPSGVLILVLSYLLVLLPAGQAWDDGLFLEERSAPRVLVRELTTTLHWSNALTWIVRAGVLVVIGAARRRTSAGALAAAGFLVTIALAEALKVVLPRPNWDVDSSLDLTAKAMDTWPSGHTASVTAFVLALIILVPRPALSIVVVGGAIATAAFGMGVVLAGWHRPSDVFGGAALALIVFLVGPWQRRASEAATLPRWMAWLPVASAVGAGVLAFLFVRESLRAAPLIVVMAAFAAWATITTVGYARAVRGPRVTPVAS